MSVSQTLWQRIKFHCTDNQRPLAAWEYDLVAIFFCGLAAAFIGWLVALAITYVGGAP